MNSTKNEGAAGGRRSIANAFEKLGGKIAFMPFVPAGWPDLAMTRRILPALERGGADLIEVGIPFSDPIADGPVIQAAFTEALEKGIKLGEIFQTIRETRSELSIPLVCMVSYSIVFRYGVPRFCAEAKDAGFDGLIIPDLPPPEAQAVCGTVKAAGLETILLVSPTTSTQRRREIADLCSGFVYYLSVTGITGERDRLPEGLERNVKELQAVSRVPVCVGFGISKPEHLKQLEGVAQGAIVGSGIVKRMRQHLASGIDETAKQTEAYCRELLTRVR